MTSSHEKKLFNRVLRMVNENEYDLDARVLIWVIYGEIDAKLYELEFVKQSMEKYKTADMFRIFTEKADFTTQINKPLVELLAGVKMNNENQDEIEDEVVGKVFKFIRKLTKLLPNKQVVSTPTTSSSAASAEEATSSDSSSDSTENASLPTRLERDSDSDDDSVMMGFDDDLASSDSYEAATEEASDDDLQYMLDNILDESE